MSAATSRTRFRSLVSALAVAGVLSGAAALFAASTLEPTGYIWLDSDDTPLPFQDRASIVEALKTADVVEHEVMARGVAKNVKLLLDHGGVRFKAVMRVINEEVREKTGSYRIVFKYRDSYIFELAAYDLSELLGLGRVPPTVRRGLGGRDGTVQIWMEGTTPEDILLEEGRLKPPDIDLYRRQKAVMRVFDALIANTDRNQGNLLVDQNWNLWFIDHTRAFRETSVLFESKKLTRCDRSFWNALVTTSDEALRSCLDPYLTSRELSRLLLRRNKLVKHFRKLIKKQGEDAVLFDLNP